MGKLLRRALVAALVAGVGMVAVPTSAQAAEGCGDGWKKHRDGYFTKDDFRRFDTSHSMWTYHSGMVRACTKLDGGWGLDDERRRVLIGYPADSYAMRSEVRPSGTYSSQVCAKQTIKARMSGVRTSSGYDLKLGASITEPISVNYSAETQDLTLTIPFPKNCGRDRALISEVSGMQLTADDEAGKIEWVELTTAISTTYTNSSRAKVQVNHLVTEKDYTSADDEPGGPPPTDPPPPPPPAVCDNDCWRAQFGTEPYNYIENSNPSDPRLARIIFDRKWYAAAYPDVRPWAEGKVATQGGNFYDHVQWHWLNYGIPWGRAGSATFDPIFYMNTHPDVSAAYGWNNYTGAIGHFISYGRFEGRRASHQFDANYYRNRYGDLAGWANWAVLDHFTNNGMSEGRQGSAEFAPAFYMAAHADLRAAYGTNGYHAGMSHWYAHGRAEGRIAVP